MLEVTFRPIKNARAYVSRGKVKLDLFLQIILYYLYTDIGKN